MNRSWFWFLGAAWVAAPFVLEGALIQNNKSTITERVQPIVQHHQITFGFICLEVGAIAGGLIVHFLQQSVNKREG